MINTTERFSPFKITVMTAALVILCIRPSFAISIQERIDNIVRLIMSTEDNTNSDALKKSVQGQISIVKTPYFVEEYEYYKGLSEYVKQEWGDPEHDSTYS